MDIDNNNHKIGESNLNTTVMEDVGNDNNRDNDHEDKDICRVCRLESDQPLYHPCLCTGSIKYIHQDCLLQWLKYSKKEVCELCNHKFSFKPLYREDMPERLPYFDLFKGIISIMARFLRFTITYCLVAIAWLGIVPLLASRTYKIVFSGLLSSFFSPRIYYTLILTENAAVDIARGLILVAIFLCTFISLIWLREQVLVSGPQHFLYLNLNQQNAAANAEENVEDANPDANDERNDNNPDGQQQRANEPVDQNRQIPFLGIPALPNNNRNQDGHVAANNNENQAIDRLVDDLTWQRLLGLDGTFAYIEHVFWTISLNIVFNIAFLYWPAQIGKIGLDLFLGLTGVSPDQAHIHFELPISVLIGYVMIYGGLFVLHKFAKIFHLASLYTITGVFYLMLKVFLLIITEVLLFPIICGWWLDICSLSLTGVPLDTRIKGLQTYPNSSIFLHWLAGMVYIFYSASFIFVLRDLLRPGVLWFVRNLNDPDFNPIQEMIEQPISRHFRRLVASMTMFFTIILFVAYIPLALIRKVAPTVLPYRFTGSAETPLVEYSFELIILQVILPTVLEYSKAFNILKRMVRLWCRIVGGWLELDNYLLPSEKKKPRQARGHLRQPGIRQLQQNAIVAPPNDANENVAMRNEDILEENLPPNVDEPDNMENLNQEDAVEVEEQIQQDVQENAAAIPLIGQRGDLAVRHQALLMVHGQHGTRYQEDYRRPNYFPLRIALLLVFVTLTATLLSFVSYVLPVTIGRVLVHNLPFSHQPFHDFYTVVIGLYVLWIVCRGIVLMRKWFHEGWTYVKKVFNSTVCLAFRIFAAAIPLLMIIPFMLGIYFQLLVIAPLRVSIFQNPLFFLWKEWAMGVVHFKIICAFVLMGPDWWLKVAFEEIYAAGWRFRLKDLYLNLVLPIINFLAFLIAFPYAITGIILFFVDRLTVEEQVILIRYSYPVFMSLILSSTFFIWQWTTLKNLALRIRNEKYLVGTQLCNFYRDQQNVNNASQQIK